MEKEEWGMLNTISVQENIIWHKIEPEGSIYCPDCGAILLVFSLDRLGLLYAFCRKCEQYFWGIERDE